MLAPCKLRRDESTDKCLDHGVDQEQTSESTNHSKRKSWPIRSQQCSAEKSVGPIKRRCDQKDRKNHQILKLFMQRLLNINVLFAWLRFPRLANFSPVQIASQELKNGGSHQAIQQRQFFDHATLPTIVGLNIFHSCSRW